MIPKIIHYCWFGHNPLPDYAKKYIATWRKYLPGYEIKEWNEDNFDVNIIPYTAEAYKAKKYAFVSDYARFWVLYHYGGIYFDTDVEVIKPMDDIIARGPFMGAESWATEDKYQTVNPGLGLGCEKGMPIFKKILDNYSRYHFINEDGSLNLRTVVHYTTVEFVRQGMKRSNEIQQCTGVYLYPKDYFNPKGGDVMQITDNTRTIHQYSSSWVKGRNGVVDITSFKFKLNKKKADLKHFLKKFTLRDRKRLVITNDYLSECFSQTYSLTAASPFDGAWIAPEDFVNIDKMIKDLQNGRYEFITMERSNFADKIYYDYPILRLTGCGAEVHYEHKDSEEDVQIQLKNTLGRLSNKRNLFILVTDDADKAKAFRSLNEDNHLIVSSQLPDSDFHVSSLEACDSLNAECKNICRHIAHY